jgi:hypothetical protein
MSAEETVAALIRSLRPRPVEPLSMVEIASRGARLTGDSQVISLGATTAYNPPRDYRYLIHNRDPDVQLQMYDGAAWRIINTATLDFTQWTFYQRYDPTVPEAHSYRVYNSGAGATYVGISWERTI